MLKIVDNNDSDQKLSRDCPNNLNYPKNKSSIVATIILNGNLKIVMVSRLILGTITYVQLLQSI